MYFQSRTLQSEIPFSLLRTFGTIMMNEVSCLSFEEKGFGSVGLRGLLIDSSFVANLRISTNREFGYARTRSTSSRTGQHAPPQLSKNFEDGEYLYYGSRTSYSQRPRPAERSVVFSEPTPLNASHLDMVGSYRTISCDRICGQAPRWRQI